MSAALPYLPHEIDAHPDAARIWATLAKYGVTSVTHEIVPVVQPHKIRDLADEIDDAISELRSAASDAESAADMLRDLARNPNKQRAS